MTLPLRVVKLGGSLLDRAELSATFRLWLERQPSACTVLIVGGGSLVDRLRALDRLHQLGEEAAHDLCLQTMRVTAALAGHLWPEAALCQSFEEVRLWRVRGQDRSSLVVLDLWMPLLLAERAAGKPVVPHLWSVTSDSLAAWAARELNADEFVLLKSTMPADDAALADLAASGFVDERFPYFAAEIGVVRIVDLRSPLLAERRALPARPE